MAPKQINWSLNYVTFERMCRGAPAFCDFCFPKGNLVKQLHSIICIAIAPWGNLCYFYSVAKLQQFQRLSWSNSSNKNDFFLHRLVNGCQFIGHNESLTTYLLKYPNFHKTFWKYIHKFTISVCFRTSEQILFWELHKQVQKLFNFLALVQKSKRFFFKVPGIPFHLVW